LLGDRQHLILYKFTLQIMQSDHGRSDIPESPLLFWIIILAEKQHHMIYPELVSQYFCWSNRSWKWNLPLTCWNSTWIHFEKWEC
jgi:hypothetical protein